MGHRLTPDQMVRVKAIAPFEIAEAMVLWSERAEADYQALHVVNPCDCDIAESMAWANGLGLPFQVNGETREAFGLRVATAIFTLLKEI